MCHALSASHPFTTERKLRFRSRFTDKLVHSWYPRGHTDSKRHSWDFRLQSCYPLTQIPRKWHCPQPIRALVTETQGVCVGWEWGRRGRWGTQHGSGPGAAFTGGRSPRVLGATNLSSEDEASSPLTLKSRSPSSFPAWATGSGGFSHPTPRLLLPCHSLPTPISSQQPPHFQAVPCNSLMKFLFLL